MCVCVCACVCVCVCVCVCLSVRIVCRPPALWAPQELEGDNPSAAAGSDTPPPQVPNAEEIDALNALMNDAVKAGRFLDAHEYQQQIEHLQAATTPLPSPPPNKRTTGKQTVAAAIRPSDLKPGERFTIVLTSKAEADVRAIEQAGACPPRA